MLDYLLEEPCYDVHCPVCKDWVEADRDGQIVCLSCEVSFSFRREVDSVPEYCFCEE